MSSNLQPSRAPATGFTTAADVVAQRIGQATVLVHMGTNRIYELNETGARLWELLAAGHAWADVVDRLRAEFDVDDDRLVREVDDFLTLLLDEGLASETAG